MPPLVSVIIPCHNGARFLPRSVGCTLSQSLENLECIIVDDASPDNTREVAESLMRQDSRVRYVYNTGKHGLAGVRNFGVRHARGEWIQLYDVDDYLYPEKIKQQLDFLKTNKVNSDQDIVIYSDFEVACENTEGDVEQTMTNTVGEHTNQELLNKIMTWGGGPTMPFHVNSMLFKRTVFDKKMFNEDLIGFEEIELFADLLYKNISFVYVPVLSMSYRIHDTNVTKDNRRFQIGYIQFLEAMHRIDPALVHLSPLIGKMIHQTLKNGDQELFDLILSLINKTKVPFSFTYKKIEISNLLTLQLLIFLKKLFVFLKKFAKIY